MQKTIFIGAVAAALGGVLAHFLIKKLDEQS